MLFDYISKIFKFKPIPLTDEKEIQKKLISLGESQILIQGHALPEERLTISNNNQSEGNIDESSEAHALLPVLKGWGEHYQPCYDAPMPTDPGKVVKNYSELLSKPRFFKNFIEAIKLLSWDPEYAWLSLYYIYNVIIFCKLNEIPLDISGVFCEIEAGIIANKSSLERNFKWLGWMNSNGLWGTVVNFSKTLEQLFNIEFKDIRSCEKEAY
jgi:hypothetical protein